MTRWKVTPGLTVDFVKYFSGVLEGRLVRTCS